MEFTYEAYRGLLRKLKEYDYAISDYYNYENYDKAAILRHDVDFSVSKAIDFAKIENEEDVRGTYFVLLSTDFYNVNSKETLKGLRELQRLGGKIGLHYDETKYDIRNTEQFVESVLKEKKMLEYALETEISVVSMHRPSKWILEQRIDIPGMKNSYDPLFFEEFKYISDSRRCWREDVETIVASNLYNRLQILTHAFWYDEQEKTAKQALSDFVRFAKWERYRGLSDNVRDIEEFIREEDLRGI